MREIKSLDSSFNVEQLSKGKSDPVWSIAVFAHNESLTIQSALESVSATTESDELEVYVLVNGCTDSTVKKVRDCATTVSNLWLIEIEIADKANAWNLFVHDVLTPEHMKRTKTIFFMDGDVTIAPNTLPVLAAALAEVPTAEAVGAVPASGRDRVAWRQRMVANGMLSGNCYGLRGSFVDYLRKQKIRMPIGLIGEDFFVSWLVSSDVWREDSAKNLGPRCIFHNDAEFFFRSLSRWRPADYKIYMFRKWRYTLRALQHQMLLLLLTNGGLGSMPKNVTELYRWAPLPSRLKWCGLDTPLRLIAVQWIRRQSRLQG